MKHIIGNAMARLTITLSDAHYRALKEIVSRTILWSIPARMSGREAESIEHLKRVIEQVLSVSPSPGTPPEAPDHDQPGDGLP